MKISLTTEDIRKMVALCVESLTGTVSSYGVDSSLPVSQTNDMVSTGHQTDSVPLSPPAPLTTSNAESASETETITQTRPPVRRSAGKDKTYDPSSDEFEAMPIPPDALSWFPKLKAALLKYKMEPYSKGNFDCSGLVRHAMQDVFGPTNFQGYTCDAQVSMNALKTIEKDKLRAGDLCYINGGKPIKRTLKKNGKDVSYTVTITHVGVYIGNGKVYHSNGSGKRRTPNITTLTRGRFNLFKRYAGPGA